MAKLKGPLLSMDARGQIGKSLVFLGWKGIKTARSHVVPANPNTAAQQVQRGVMTAAVAKWHAVPKGAYDIAAFNLAASLQAKAMSGFNWFCKTFIAIDAADELVVAVTGFKINLNTGGGLTPEVNCVGATNMLCAYGDNPRVFGAPELMTHTAESDQFYTTILNRVAGSYTYVKFLVQEPSGSTAISGIYKVLIIE